MDNIIGIDQYGSVFQDLGNAPRKTLLERLCKTHCDKIYLDDVHVGYVIGGLWITLYRLSTWEG